MSRVACLSNSTGQMDPIPSVTVVIPTYNAAGFIEETLRSVLGQTFGDFEVIVIDDGSTDETCSIASAMGAKVRVLKQKRAGVCVARNRGLHEARGRYICFLDHDDVWHREKLSRQLEAFDRDPDLALIHTHMLRWHEDTAGGYPPSQTLFEEHPSTELDADQSGWAYHHLLVDSFILTSTAMMRVDAVREVGAFDPALPYSEDWDLWLRLSRKWRFAKLRGAFALYRQHRLQGSRVHRDIDYRTQLLERAVATWGLASPDGQSHGARAVWRRIGLFHAGYGLDCLRAGDLSRATHAFLRAWRCDPLQPKYLAYVAAGRLGWRPTW